MDLSTTDLVLLAAGLLLTGVAAGILAGLLGVGGGIVIVPVLFHIFTSLGIDESVRMHIAVGTSLATIIPTALSSSRAHWTRGSVDLDLLKSWGPAILLGVLASTIWGVRADGMVLTGLFGVVALLVAANMAFRSDNRALAETLPGGPVRWGLGVVIGAISTLMGIGGGTLSVPVLTAFSYPIRRAVGTASAIGLIIAIPGAIGFTVNGIGLAGRPPWSLGYVSLPGFAVIVVATVVSAPVGARIAHAIDPRRLRQAFAVFLFLTSLRMLWSVAR